MLKSNTHIMLPLQMSSNSAQSQQENPSLTLFITCFMFACSLAPTFLGCVLHDRNNNSMHKCDLTYY